MKFSTTFVVIIFLAISGIQAQDSSMHERHLTLKATVKPNQGDHIKGFLVNVEDSSILLADFPVSFSAIHKQEYSRRIDYSQIYSVKTQRKGSVGRGIVFGAMTGMVVGLIAGYASGDDPPETIILPLTAGEKAISLGAVGIVAGGGIGAIIGALAHKTFIIGGNKEKFHEMKLTVLERIYSN